MGNFGSSVRSTGSIFSNRCPAVACSADQIESNFRFNRGRRIPVIAARIVTPYFYNVRLYGIPKTEATTRKCRGRIFKGGDTAPGVISPRSSSYRPYCQRLETLCGISHPRSGLLQVVRILVSGN